MFTGIVQSLCPVVAVEDTDGIRRLTVDLGSDGVGLERGASVANNGVCLTATDIDRSLVTFDVIGETLAVTNLGRLAVGDLVNIERSMSYGDEIGGHIVSGHVSTVATVDLIEVDGASRTTWFRTTAEAMPFLLLKGFVAVDGASLTISRIDRATHRFAVSLIPETLARTTLGRLVPGAPVNIEFEAQTQAIVTTVRQLFSDPDTRDQILGDLSSQPPGQSTGTPAG